MVIGPTFDWTEVGTLDNEEPARHKTRMSNPIAYVPPPIALDKTEIPSEIFIVLKKSAEMKTALVAHTTFTREAADAIVANAMEQSSNLLTFAVVGPYVRK